MVLYDPFKVIGQYLKKGMLNPSFRFVSAFQLFPPSVGGSEGFIRGLRVFSVSFFERR